MSGFDFDVVCIGSGAGGLTASLALARAGERVALFEAHHLPGGWCHSFRRKGYRFSPGVHYLGKLQLGGSLRRIYEGLGLGEDLRFFSLPKEGMDRVHLGGESFSIPSSPELWAEKLSQRFPAESRGIHSYLKTVESLDKELSHALDFRSLWDLLSFPFRAPRVLRWGLRTGMDLISAHVSDPVVQGIFSAQAGDYGLAPSQVSALVHAGVQAHYFEGAWYPEGGGGAIPRAYLKQFRRHGGHLEVGCPVTKIRLERGKVQGVELADGRVVRAPVVISNADPEATYSGLFQPEELPAGLRRKLDRQVYSISAISLFLAARLDPEALDLDAGNLWIYPKADVDACYRESATTWIEEGRAPPGVFATVTSLKDPSPKRDSIHTLEAFSFAPFQSFRAWEESRMGSRPQAYLEAKRDLEDRMLEVLERRMPGLKENLVFQELGTPLTKRHYCRATQGSLYGTAKLRSQIGPWGFSLPGSFPGLYLCGASTLSHGVMGATRSGLEAAARVLRVRPSELLGEGLPEIRLLDPAQVRLEMRSKPPRP